MAGSMQPRIRRCQPHSWEPLAVTSRALWGRDGATGLPYICERFERAFGLRYGGVTGSIYVLPGDTFLEGETPWEEEVVSPEAVVPIREIRVDDAKQYLLRLVEEGKLILKRYPDRIDVIPEDDEDLVQRAALWYRQSGDAVLERVKQYHPHILDRVKCAINHQGNLGKRTAMGKQPAQLRRGRIFEARVKADWERTAEGTVENEKSISLVSGRTKSGRVKRGRMDMFVDDLGDFVSVVEIKATDWDRILPNNVQRNLSSHRRQVWKYIDKHLDVDMVNVCAGIIYPSAPKTPGLQKRIEEYHGSYGLQVVWYDEPAS